MRTSFALSVAALAGRSLAAPVDAVNVVIETQLETVYVTEEYAAPTPVVVTEEYTAPTTVVVYEEYTVETPAAVYEEYTVATPAAVYDAPVVYTVVYEEPAPTTSSTRRTRTRKVPSATPTIVYNEAYTPAAPTPVYTEVVVPTVISTPPATSAPAATPVTPATGTGYMGVVEAWRSKMGLSALAHDDKLESNAKDCVVSSAGQMKHKLNTGSFGQVLAPGDVDNFEHVFLGGWLCEIPTLAGLNGICATASDGWSYQGQTGHAEILTSPNYSKIGCACFDGIWACDLA